MAQITLYGITAEVPQTPVIGRCDNGRWWFEAGYDGLRLFVSPPVAGNCKIAPDAKACFAALCAAEWERIGGHGLVRPWQLIYRSAMRSIQRRKSPKRKVGKSHRHEKKHGW